MDIVDRQNVFKVVDKDQDQQMLFGITLLLGGREQIILCVVVDHGLGEDFVIFITL